MKVEFAHGKKKARTIPMVCLKDGEIAVIENNDYKAYNGLIVYHCYEHNIVIGHIDNKPYEKNTCWGNDCDLRVRLISANLVINEE
jgi:hypothetical protein